MPLPRSSIADRTRICMTVHDHAGRQEYRFVAEGPEVSAAELYAGLDAVDSEASDWLIASGSLPRGVHVDSYVRSRNWPHGTAGNSCSIPRVLRCGRRWDTALR